MRLISIIIPVYNAICYLPRCLDSILAQDYPSIEVVLVDDGSTDGSGCLCDEYAAKDERIRVIHQDNQGASFARKVGISKARGEYVSFVDSDDWISPQYVSTLFQLIEKYQVKISSCGVCRVLERENVQVVKTQGKDQLLPFEKLIPRFFKYEFWGFPGKMYRKDVFDGITFPKATLSEDYYVMVQLFNSERQIAYTDEPLYFYEYHENSLSHQKLSKRAFEEFENVKAVYDYTCKHMPEYADYALSNVVETCVKLLKREVNNTGDNYKENFFEIRSFLKKHLFKIIKCSPLCYKTKLLSVIRTFFPQKTNNKI